MPCKSLRSAFQKRTKANRADKEQQKRKCPDWYCTRNAGPVCSCHLLPASVQLESCSLSCTGQRYDQRGRKQQNRQKKRAMFVMTEGTAFFAMMRRRVWLRQEMKEMRLCPRDSAAVPLSCFHVRRQACRSGRYQRYPK